MFILPDTNIPAELLYIFLTVIEDVLLDISPEILTPLPSDEIIFPVTEIPVLLVIILPVILTPPIPVVSIGPN